MSVLVWWLIIGIIFGIFLQQAKVIRFDKQVGAMVLKDMTIFKYMLSAIIVAMIWTYILLDMGMIELSVKSFILGNIVVGWALFGIGWAIAWYCPGTAFWALWEGRYDAFVMILGGIVGAGLYSLVYPISWLKFWDLGKVTLPQLLGVSHWAIIPIIIVLFVWLFIWFEKKKV